MKSLLMCATVAVLGLSAGPCFALTIDFATGQNPSGTISTVGDTQDVNWKASNANNYKSAPNSYVVDPTNADWFGGWFANGPNSSWIAPDPDHSNNGNFTLTYTFDLTGYDLSTASFSGTQWTLDDGGTLALNGNTLDTRPGGQWGSFHSFTVPLGDLLPGVNMLTMTDVSDNFLEAARLEGTLTINAVSQVPIPATLPLLASGLGLLGAAARRKRKNASAA